MSAENNAENLSPEGLVHTGGITRVFIICHAYESGMGHGLQRDGLANPYTPLGEEWEAYAIGYEQGADRAARRD